MTERCPLCGVHWRWTRAVATMCLSCYLVLELRCDRLPNGWWARPCVVINPTDVRGPTSSVYVLLVSWPAPRPRTGRSFHYLDTWTPYPGLITKLDLDTIFTNTILSRILVRCLPSPHYQP